MSICRLLVNFIVIGLTTIFVSACNQASPVATIQPSLVVTTEIAGVSPEPSRTPVPPTSTPIPLAAVVNGEPITLAEFQAELNRFQASVTITGTNLASDAETIVLTELIDQILLAQSAAENDFNVDDTMLQSRIEALETGLGSKQALDEWKDTHGYSDEDFQQALRRSIGAAWMRDQIIAAVPETMDQVRVIQILLYSAAEADELYKTLQSGADFRELAAEYDPVTGGDLGWFPRGYLREPAIDEAVFALQLEQYSQVVETEIGFHILYLMEKDPNHVLLPDARMTLQEKALQDWISEHRNQSDIQILLP